MSGFSVSKNTGEENTSQKVFLSFLDVTASLNGPANTFTSRVNKDINK